MVFKLHCCMRFENGVLLARLAQGTAPGDASDQASEEARFFQ